jgi:hypothetical protein
MKKYLFLLGGLTLLATPANAITWKEFWEPFDGHHSHNYHYHYYNGGPHRPSVCHKHFHSHERSGIIHEHRHCHGNGYSHHGEDQRHPVYTTPGKYYF